jgi:hypothetical protein
MWLRISRLLEINDTCLNNSNSGGNVYEIKTSLPYYYFQDLPQLPRSRGCDVGCRSRRTRTIPERKYYFSSHTHLYKYTVFKANRHARRSYVEAFWSKLLWQTYKFNDGYDLRPYSILKFNHERCNYWKWNSNSIHNLPKKVQNELTFSL